MVGLAGVQGGDRPKQRTTPPRSSQEWLKPMRESRAASAPGAGVRRCSVPKGCCCAHSSSAVRAAWMPRRRFHRRGIHRLRLPTLRRRLKRAVDEFEASLAHVKAIETGGRGDERHRGGAEGGAHLLAARRVLRRWAKDNWRFSDSGKALPPQRPSGPSVSHRGLGPNSRERGSATQ